MKRLLVLVLGLALAGSAALGQTVQQNQLQDDKKLDKLEKNKATTKPDSTSDMSEQQQMRMQMYQDQRSKAQQNLSNTMKKNSDTDSAIIQNMK